MIVSPIQLRFYNISRVSVAPRERAPLALIGPTPVQMDWNGINITSEVEFGWADNQGDNPAAFAVRLHLRVPNDAEKKAPYDVDLEAIGYFDLITSYPIDEREDIAKVNGASLLYGVLREILCSLTARFPQGLIVLPGVNFFDLKAKFAGALNTPQYASPPSVPERRTTLSEPPPV